MRVLGAMRALAARCREGAYISFWHIVSLFLLERKTRTCAHELVIGTGSYAQRVWIFIFSGSDGHVEHGRGKWATIVFRQASLALARWVGRCFW